MANGLRHASGPVHPSTRYINGIRMFAFLGYTSFFPDLLMLALDLLRIQYYILKTHCGGGGGLMLKSIGSFFALVLLSNNQ